MKRRIFIRPTVTSGALAGMGHFAFLGRLPAVGGDAAKAAPHMVRLHPEIEPLVRHLTMAPAWRDRFLAASVFNFKGTAHPDSDLVPRIREALGA